MHKICGGRLVSLVVYFQAEGQVNRIVVPSPSTINIRSPAIITKNPPRLLWVGLPGEAAIFDTLGGIRSHSQTSAAIRFVI
jgi:hypothetical protein